MRSGRNHIRDIEELDVRYKDCTLLAVREERGRLICDISGNGTYYTWLVSVPKNAYLVVAGKNDTAKVGSILDRMKTPDYKVA